MNPVHTLILAAIIRWFIWKRRNKVCFKHKDLQNLAEIITHACTFLSYLAGLYSLELQGKIMEGVELLLSCEHKVRVQPSRSTSRLLPTDVDP